MAIQEALDGVTWMEQVSDEEYLAGRVED